MKNYETPVKAYEHLPVKILWMFCVLCAASLFINAQSTNQNFPTPVTSNEISGTIRARDIGDARLTSYFYVFNGSQGDVFMNVVTNNLDGDIDVFTADNLRPLTKIRVYSDNPEGETGRVIYLRQPQKLILRIEGRTPNDDPASFRIKFAGSFQPMIGVAESEESKQPEVRSIAEGEVRVNSVGTIIEVKPSPSPKTETAKVEVDENVKRDEQAVAEKDEPAAVKRGDPEEARAETKPEVIITDNLPVKKDESEIKPDEDVAEKETASKTPPAKREVKPRRTRTNTRRTAVQPEKKSEPPTVEPAELGNIRLIVDFKDGRKIERPMSEVLKFGVDKGILTIIAKDGSMGRYSILDIAKITVE